MKTLLKSTIILTLILIIAITKITDAQTRVLQLLKSEVKVIDLGNGFSILAAEGYFPKHENDTIGGYYWEDKPQRTSFFWAHTLLCPNGLTYETLFTRRGLHATITKTYKYRNSEIYLFGISNDSYFIYHWVDDEVKLLFKISEFPEEIEGMELSRILKIGPKKARLEFWLGSEEHVIMKAKLSKEGNWEIKGKS